MSFSKFKNNSYCVGGKHYSTTINIRGDITQNKKTGAPVKLLRGTCSTCKRNKSLIVSDQTIQAEELGNFLNIWARQPRMSERKYSIFLEEH